jgi:serine/threonine-protein kinase
MPELLTGARVAGRYVVEARLGAGGMGVVFRARDERLSRPVAIKVLSADAIGDAVARARLVREARAGAAIDHPAIVHVYDVGETDDGGAYLVMELVRGHGLRALVAAGPASAADATRIVREIAAALGVAHRAGFVHRDVKPDNVMIRDDGRVAILDFGLAKLMAPPAGTTSVAGAPLTTERGFVGTPTYMAPEQAEGGEVDGRADQFALGVVAFELLTGRLPWSGTTGLAIIAELLHRPPPPPSRFAPHLGPEVDAVMARALTRRPADRFPTIEGFADALSAALPALDAPRPAAPPPPIRPFPSGVILGGRYRVVGLGARDGGGETYDAEDTDGGARVRLDCLDGAGPADPAAHDRLERELTRARAVEHPGVLQLRGAARHGSGPDELLFAVYESCAGPTLAAVLRERQRLSEAEAAPLAQQIAAALDAAHEAGVLHGALSPDRVVIAAESDGPRVKVSGFGGGGAPLSSPAHLSPEQVRGDPITARTDVYAFGLLLYEMVTGTGPWSGGTVISVVAKRLVDAPPRPTSLVPGLDPRWEAVILRCLERDPEARFARAGEAAAALAGEGKLERARPARRWGRARAVSVVGALVGVAALAALSVGFWRGREAPIPVGKPRQLTSAPGWEAEPALSPDGNFVAYASDEKGNADIWLVDARGGTPLRLTDDPAEDRSPTWFPDGSAIAFASNRGGQWGVWKVRSLGGSATQVMPDAMDPAISPDGTMIAFTRPSARKRLVVWTAPLSHVERATALTSDADSVWQHRRPVWSNDGKRLAYEDFSNVWVVPASGGPSRRVTTGNGGDGWATWSPDDRYLYFSGLRENTLALWRVRSTGGEVRRVTMGMGPEVQPNLSRDGGRLAYSTFAQDRELVLIDLATGARSHLSSLGRVLDLAIAPDGGSVLYVSERQGSINLWAQPIEGLRPRGEPQRLTELPGSIACPTFSPDGRWIAAHRVVDGQRDIWILPSTGGIPAQLTSDPGTDVQPAWSADGTRVAFVSDRSGTYQIWSVQVSEGKPAGEAIQMTNGGGDKSNPAWSPTGARLYYLEEDAAADGADVWSISTSGEGAPVRLTTGSVGASARLFAEPGSLFLSGTWGERRMTLRRVFTAATAGPPAKLDVDFGSAEIGKFDVSRDGRRLVLMREDTRGDVWLLDTRDGSAVP